MEYLQLGQYALVWVELLDEARRPVEVYGEPVFASSDTTMLSCGPSVGNPGYAQIQGLQVGQAQISADAQYDTGKGIKQVGKVLDFEIINQKVATAEIKVSHGEVVSVGEQSTQKAKAK